MERANITRIREKAIVSYVRPAPAPAHTNVLPHQLSFLYLFSFTYPLSHSLIRDLYFLLSSPHTDTVVSPILGYLFYSQLPGQGKKVIPVLYRSFLWCCCCLLLPTPHFLAPSVTHSPSLPIFFYFPIGPLETSLSTFLFPTRGANGKKLCRFHGRICSLQLTSTFSPHQFARSFQFPSFFFYYMPERLIVSSTIRAFFVSSSRGKGKK